ncbi:mannitol 2-dehydrogenase [Salinibacterium amurskyense]|uniref:Mannitol-1-phosphate 5-dehydrogenase n=1 Tax=Salinibacterium amurskyense TaxID=205941 RepID=A0A2M9D5U1_9MICO|nr:mannitol 2-dehydrogenase [Salinibacterium amurskyense]RLQ82929.1 mannitol dehydrogenase family protein [Salinibacterium amurskyense]GHD82152.1 mannitol 2-dehydrogenase [Salinibacterium amurskyense]
MVFALNSDSLTSLDPRVSVPQYDRANVSVGIVHLGVGGFHRAHQAVVVDDLLAAGHRNWGICGVGLMPNDAVMRDVMQAQDSLYSLVTRAASGEESVRVIGSIVEYIFGPDDPDQVLRRLTDPETKIVSLTITEGGYLQNHASGDFDPDSPMVISDLSTPSRPTGAFGYIVEAVRLRRERGIAPFTVMSCDNIRSNGDVARAATVGLATLRSTELGDWIEKNVVFPNSMVDRITPVTAASELQHLRDEYGIDDSWPVASENFFQWVLEDNFGLGRPPFADAGVELVDDVLPFELMKLRLLNGSHQVIAYLGLLMGYRLVHDAAQDPVMRELLRAFWAKEAIPSLQKLQNIDYSGYSETLLERYSNPHIRDTLERLATDASNRIPIFVLPIAQHCVEGGRAALACALTVAGWAKFVEGVDDNGDPLTQNDAHSAELSRRVQHPSGPDSFLADSSVFGALGSQADFVAQFEEMSKLVHSLPVRDAIKHACASMNG